MAPPEIWNLKTILFKTKNVFSEYFLMASRKLHFRLADGLVGEKQKYGGFHHGQVTMTRWEIR